MKHLTIIDGHDLGDHIVVIDRMGEETHYIDLNKVVGVSIMPGNQLLLRFEGGPQALTPITNREAEDVVNLWLALNSEKSKSRKRKAG